MWRKTETGIHLQSPDPLKQSDKTEGSLSYDSSVLIEACVSSTALSQGCEEPLLCFCTILNTEWYKDYSPVRKLLTSGVALFTLET